MLLAVRSSLREIDGLCKQKKTSVPKKKTRDVASTTMSSSPDDARPIATTAIDFEEVPNHGTSSQNPVHGESTIEDDIDPGGDEPPLQRRLSKSERRRLRKLARNGRAA